MPADVVKEGRKHRKRVMEIASGWIDATGATNPDAQYGIRRSRDESYRAVDGSCVVKLFPAALPFLFFWGEVVV